MITTLVRNAGKRLVGLLLLALAATGLSLVSVVTAATTASATDAAGNPTAEERFLANEILDFVDADKIRFEDRWQTDADGEWPTPSQATEDIEMIRGYAEGTVKSLDGRPCYIDVRLMRALVGLVTPVDEGGAGYEYIYISSLNRSCRNHIAKGSSPDSSRHWILGGGGAIDINVFRPSGGSDIHVKANSLEDEENAIINFAIAFVTAAGGLSAPANTWAVGQDNFYNDNGRYAALGIIHQWDPNGGHIHIQLAATANGNYRSYPVAYPGTPVYPPANPDGSDHCYTGSVGTQVCFAADGSGVFTNAPNPMVNGDPVVDSTLIANTLTTTYPDLWEPTPDTWLFKWYRSDGEDVSGNLVNKEEISGAIAQGYVLTQDDIDKYISIEVTGKKNGYRDELVKSTPVLITAEPFYLLPSPATISYGEAVVDSPLFTDISTSWLPAPDPGTVTYEWRRSETADINDDGELISTATGPNYTLTQDDIGKYVWVEVTGKRVGYRDATVESVKRQVTAEHFGFTGTPEASILGTPQVEHTLTASSNISTPDVVPSVTWYRGVDEELGSGSNYVLSSAHIDSDIWAEVTFSKPGFQTQVLTTDAVHVAGYSTYLFVTYEAAILGTPKFGNTLTSDTTLNPSPPGLTTTIEWLMYNSTSGAWDVWQTGVSSVNLTSWEAGARIKVRYWFDAPGYLAQSYDSSPVVVDYAFSGTPISISGTPKIEYSLTASTTIATPDVSWTIEWLRNVNGVNTVVSTGSRTYTPTSADIGYPISVKYTFSKTGRETLFYTASAGTIANYDYFYPTGSPSVGISGTTRVEFTLSSYANVAPTPSSTSYQWYRGTSPIYQAWGKSYTLTSDDVGKVIKVRYTFDRLGSPVTVWWSAGVTIAGYYSYSFAGIPVSVYKNGRTLTASTTCTTPATVTKSYQWYKVGNSTVLSRNSTYTGTIGSSYYVKVTFNKTDAPGYQPVTYTSTSVKVT